MRRDKRGMYEESDNYKTILIVAGVLLVVAIVSFFVIYGIYNNKLEAVKLATSDENGSKIEISKPTDSSTEVSSSIGKNVEEAKSEMTNGRSETEKSENNSDGDNKNVDLIGNENKKVEENASNNSNVTNVKKEDKKDNENSSSNIKEEKDNIKVEETPAVSGVQENSAKNKNEEKEPKFIIPVEDGEVIREYAKDNLVYSETLKEWITHLGIDIKAPKTTIVKAAENGEVESVKNDPRYGLTVIIKHNNDYKTVYANLLTTEFVNVGDKVEKGQSIGTVGNNAPFEIADEPHLHFEIIKNNEKVDPNLYF